MWDFYCNIGTNCITISKTTIHRVLALFNISVAIWGFGCFIAGIATTESAAIYGWRFGQTGGIFIAVFFYHMISIFCGLQRRFALTAIYLWGLFFLYFCFFTKLLFDKTRFVYDIYYNDATWLYASLVASWLFIVCLSFVEILIFFPKTKGLKRTQTLYLIVGFLTGFLGGASTLIPMFRINLPPFGNFTIPIYCLISTYAILRYRLMDIYLAIKRTAAYSLSAGLLMGLFVVLVIAVTNLLSTFANVSSFRISIFAAVLIAILFNPLRNWIQNLIDKIFYKKSFDYYETVRQVSSNLASMFDLEKIYQFIGDVIYDAMGLKNVYLLVGLPGGAFDIVYHTSPKKDRNIIDRSGSEKPEEMKMNKFTGILKYL